MTAGPRLVHCRYDGLGSLRSVQGARGRRRRGGASQVGGPRAGRSVAGWRRPNSLPWRCSMTSIEIRPARTHNLRSIHVDVPKHRLVAFTGVSGSGKSSLMSDTICTDAQRQLFETLSTYARRQLAQLTRRPLHRATTPVGGARRRLVRGGMYDGLHLVGCDLGLASAARTHLPNRIESIGEKARAPAQHRRPADVERGRDATVRRAVAGHQQGLGVGHHAVGRGCTERPLGQRVPICATEQQRGGGVVHARRYTTRRTKCKSMLVTHH